LRNQKVDGEDQPANGNEEQHQDADVIDVFEQDEQAAFEGLHGKTCR
jgi:hypothetical protein